MHLSHLLPSSFARKENLTALGDMMMIELAVVYKICYNSLMMYKVWYSSFFNIQLWMSAVMDGSILTFYSAVYEDDRLCSWQVSCRDVVRLSLEHRHTVPLVRCTLGQLDKKLPMYYVSAWQVPIRGYTFTLCYWFPSLNPTDHIPSLTVVII